MTSRLRSLPSIDAVLQQEQVQQLVATYSHEAVVTIIRSHLDEIRNSLSDRDPVPDLARIVESVCLEASRQWTTGPRRVINATGVVLHTNLGRAPLSKPALQAMNNAASGYSDLEFELQRGQRGSRQAHVSSLITQVSGAEAALVVNNNASAVMLGLAALARNKEVIVSRGEAVEIGGGFRIPGVLAQSGARLVEVGATNRTYLSDYESAISEETGAILKVHASNFRVTGFTHSVEIAELVALGRVRDLPVLHDLGSGCLLDVSRFGLAYEPTVQDSISAGCGLSFFSGDKLLGGPQAGIIAGSKDLVQKLSAHPLARAVRIDKLSLAALAATLLHYLKEEAITEIPVWRMISASESQLKERAMALQSAIGNIASIAPGRSAIGGGSLPGETLPTWIVAIDGNPDAMANALRQADPPVVGRIEDAKLVLDPRTVMADEEEAVVEAVRMAAGMG